MVQNLKELTVCLLLYNHKHILTEVLNSVLCQTYSNFKIIISDDCSTDDSYEIAQEFEKIDTRIKVIRTPKNLGMAGNANFAISKTDSEWVALLHHDDILSNDCFECWMSISEIVPNIGFVFNDYKTYDSNSTNHYLNNRLKTINNGKYFLKKILLKRWGCPVRGSALIRKKYFDDIGGMNENFGMLADVDLWMRLSSKFDVGYVSKPLIKVLQKRPVDYPEDYTQFSWSRIFLLFDIHSNNINGNNFDKYIKYLTKRFVFRNKVSFEIIKWHFYALFRKKINILKTYPILEYKELLFYANYINKFIRSILIKA